MSRFGSKAELDEASVLKYAEIKKTRLSSEPVECNCFECSFKTILLSRIVIRKSLKAGRIPAYPPNAAMYTFVLSFNTP